MRRLRTGDWLLVGGAGVMLVLGLATDWASVHVGGRHLGGARNAFDYPFTGGAAWALTVGAGVLALLLGTRLVEGGDRPWTRLTVGATVAATLLMVLRVALGGGADERIGNQAYSLGRGAGMWIALLAAGVAAAGALANHRAEGATVRDLLAPEGWRRVVARGSQRRRR